jgi:peptide/nickel transport system substrate-binding protein
VRPTGKPTVPDPKSKGTRQDMAITNLRMRGAVAIAVLAIAAAACGGSSNKSSSSGSSSSPSASAAAGEDAIYQPSDQKGGTLRILASSDCDYWDPQRTYYANCWNMQRLINRTLMMYDTKPGKAGAKVVPDLAAGDPEVTNSNKTWKYTLKDGLKFEDGTPITSKDIKYGIERTFATDVINGGPTYVIDELPPGKSYTGPYKDKKGLASIVTPDDKTIIFNLKRPFSDWNFVMAMPTSTPVPQAKDTGDKYTFHPVASGPYKFEKYTANKSLTLVRNTNWDPATDKVRPALPDRIEVTMGLDPNDIDSRIIANQGDVFQDGTGVQTAAQSKILTDPNLKKRSTNPQTGFLRYLVVFQKNKPFDNIHCRNAVAWAVNKKNQQLQRGGPVGGGDIATTMAPPTLNYYQQFDLFPTDQGQGNVEKAKEELKACGMPNGFSTKMAIRNKGKEPKQGESLQADLKAVGINATIDTFDASQYYAAHLGIPANVHKEGFGMGLTGWGPDWPSPYGFFHFIVDGRAILPQGNSNYGELNDPGVNSAIDEALAATDEAGKQAAWLKVDKGVVQSAVYVPLLYDKALNIVSEKTTNAYISNAFGMYDYVALGVKQ